MKSPLVFFLLILLVSCSGEESRLSSIPPTYQTLHTKNTHGAFFQIHYQGEFYIACSIHQGAAVKGLELFRKGQEKPIILGERIHIQKDLHLWKYDSKTLSPENALPYLPQIKIQQGDPIFILNKGKKIAATVNALPRNTNFRYSFISEQPFPAGGMSGSPVFLPRSGSIIGVLQTANHKTKATFGGFEKISFPLPKLPYSTPLKKSL